MGIIRNEMTIAHHYNKDKLEKVREDAIKMFDQLIRQELIDEGFVENMISPIMESIINQEYTFIINGDCSKMGWETSEKFHEVRMKWCEKHKHDVQNIVVINFGEDESCYIVFDNHSESEDADEEEKIIKMTYGDIYDEFCKKFPNAEVSDYRPAMPQYLPRLVKPIPYAIVVWLKDGSKMVYIAESEE